MNHDLPLFDAAALEPLRELEESEGPSLVEGLINDFRSNASELLTKIESAFSISDSRSIEIFSHSLKSSATLLGCVRLEHLCLEIENRAHDKQLERCRTLIDDLPALISLSIAAVQAA